MKIHITNGWVGEYQGELQLSTGKFGKLEVVGEAPAEETTAPESTPEPAPEPTPEQEPIQEEMKVEEEKIE